MKNLLTVLCIALSVTMLSSCENGEVNDKKTNEPSVTLLLDTPVFDVAAEGGSYTIEYSIENGLSGIDVVAKADDVSWISSITAADGTISFEVAPNYLAEERSGDIVVKYPNVGDKRVIVRQPAHPLSNCFSIEVKDMTSTGCTSVITPEDATMPYIVYMADIDYLYGMGIDTAEKLFMDDYVFFMDLMRQYEVEDIEQFMLMNDIAFKDVSTIKWNGLSPSTKYALYAYGIEYNEDKSDYTLTTPICYTIVEPIPAELNTVEFDVTVTVDGPEAFYEFAPVDWDGKYYIDVYDSSSFYYVPQGEEPDEAYCKMVADDWMTLINHYMASGYSAEQLYELMCLEGPDSYSQMCQADTEYMMSFYAIQMVDGLPQVVSRPYLVYFRTEVVEQSDMDINIELSNLYVRVVDVEVTPTADDPYTVMLLQTSDMPTGTDQEIMDMLVWQYNVTTFRGELTTHVNNLQPDTDYTIVAFGYHGGVITTGLFREDFRTEPEGECQNSVLGIEVTGPYSPIEYEAHYPDALHGMGRTYEEYGYYIFLQELITAEPSRDMFHYFFEPSEFMTLGDEGIISELLAYPTPAVTTFVARNDVTFVPCGVTMDERGNYSEMWVGEPFTFSLNADTKRPIEEVIEALSAAETPVPASVVIGDAPRQRVELSVAVPR